MRPLRLAPALAYMALVFHISSRPAVDVGVSDKLLHGLEYGVLTALLYGGLVGSMPAGPAALWSFAISSLYGGTDELHQMLVPGRSADGLDVLADAAGSALAAGLCMVLARRRAAALGSEPSLPAVKELDRAR
jgi:VanZ family protein